MTGVEIGLVSCTKSKRESAAPPRKLYNPSSLFRKASTYAEMNHDDWYVLSAKHGVLSPDAPPIEPYDETLTGASIAEREAWATRTRRDLLDADLLGANVTLVFHAGRAYTEPLADAVVPQVEAVQIPTEGLPIGETLAWYNDRLEDE